MKKKGDLAPKHNQVEMHFFFVGTLDGTQPLGGFRVEQLANQILGVGREVLGVRHGPVHDLGVRLHRVLVVKRRVTGQHFVDEHAQGPPVDRLAVPLARHDFRRQVVRGACYKSLPLTKHHSSKQNAAKVNKIPLK